MYIVFVQHIAGHDLSRPSSVDHSVYRRHQSSSTWSDPVEIAPTHRNIEDREICVLVMSYCREAQRSNAKRTWEKRRGGRRARRLRGEPRESAERRSLRLVHVNASDDRFWRMWTPRSSRTLASYEDSVKPKFT